MLFGGAARGGKSDALLMAAAQFLHVPGYAALLLRRNYPDLMQPDGLIPRSLEWWANKSDAHWSSQNRQWTFRCPNGGSSIIQFGYCSADNDIYRYQGSQYQFCGWDELTQFTEQQYLYLFSRQSRPATGLLSQVPLRTRAGSNPGGVGHIWCKERFIDHETAKGVYVPSRVIDNPTVDGEVYVESLGFLDAVTKAQLLEGDWEIVADSFFRGLERIQIVAARPLNEAFVRRVRFWDLAATEKQAGTDPDWTVGIEMGRHKDGSLWLLDMKRERLGPKGVRGLIKQTAAMDTTSVPIRIEREGGASGKLAAESIITEDLLGWPAFAVAPVGSKAERAEPWGAQIEAGNVRMVAANWNRPLLDEHRSFPLGTHDDIVDACSGAVVELSRAMPNIR